MHKATYVHYKCTYLCYGIYDIAMYVQNAAVKYMCIKVCYH